MIPKAIFNFRPHFRLFSTPTPTPTPATANAAVTESSAAQLGCFDKKTSANGKSETGSPVLRSGALAIKKGMMSYWDSWGKRHPATILHLDHVQALDTFKCGGFLIQNVGISHRSARQTHPAQLKYFKECGTAPKLKVHGFKISEEAQIEKGKFIYAAHFVPGQLVDVIGTSIGKGFQGAMKRWGFHGQPASHGVSLSHRSIGATGGRSDPGRVFKGKKMAGRMGGEQVTVKKLRILKIDTALNCLWVNGAVPGCDNSIIRVIDSKCPENRELFGRVALPVPTISNDLKLPREMEAPAFYSKDPLKLGE